MKTISLSLSREDQDSKQHDKNLEKIVQVYDYLNQNAANRFGFCEPETFNQYDKAMADVIRYLYEVKEGGAVLYVGYITPKDKVWNYYLLGISEKSEFYKGLEQVLNEIRGSSKIVLNIEDKVDSSN